VPRDATWASAIAGSLLAALLLAGPAAPAAGPPEAVTTPGSGILTKCRDWLVYLSCSTYHHIALPGRVAVGDDVKLTYGSNPKEYVFHIARIRRHGDGCTILSSQSGAGEEAEKIEVAPCGSAAGGSR
jgi:hypothetical protein